MLLIIAFTLKCRCKKQNLVSDSQNTVVEETLNEEKPKKNKLQDELAEFLEREETEDNDYDPPKRINFTQSTITY